MVVSFLATFIFRNEYPALPYTKISHPKTSICVFQHKPCKRWFTRNPLCTLIFRTTRLPPHSRRLIMKTLKFTLLLALSLMVSMSFASKMVKSKWGELDLMAEKGGSKILCTMGFNAELALIKEAETDALVKGDCTGWVPKSKIEYVAQKPGDRTLDMDEFDINGFVDDPSLFSILEDNIEDFDGVSIDRDFREYLTYTMDREQTEMRHGEN